MKTLDVIIPFYNEEECINPLLEELFNLRNTLKDNLDVNFIFVNDGSTDNGAKIIQDKCLQNNFIKLINLSRNFGHETAITAGLAHSQGDYTVIIDADLQDSPNLIPEMYKILCENNCHVVHAVRKHRENETLFKKISADIFYRVLKIFSTNPVTIDSGNFKLFTAKVREALKSMHESNRYIRGLIDWSGFKSTYYYYNRAGRKAGKTKYSPQQLFVLAFNAFISFADKLVYLILISAFLFLIFSIILIFLRKYTIGALVFIQAVQTFAIGLIGIYIKNISQDTKNRPLYFIDTKYNLD